MAIEQVTTHDAQAVLLLLQQFHGKPAIEALIAALTAPLNLLEGVAFDLFTKVLNIDGAEGTQLDIVGALVDRARQGLGDVDYRATIRAEIALHQSSGKRDELIDLNLSQIQILEYGPDSDAEFSAFSNDDGSGSLIILPDALALEIADLLNRGRSAGVYFTFEFGTFGALGVGNLPFAFDTALSGFDGDANMTVGTITAEDF